MDLFKIIRIFFEILLCNVVFVSATITINNIIGSPYIKTKISLPLDPNKAYYERFNYARKFGNYGENLINLNGRFANISPNNVPNLINSRSSYQQRPQFFPRYIY
ncbi:unnamed protein product [Lepeophtheirus salmonis]|uniref:(salmon louse) hypothetical protein n=1 Tax=Lepeophtheirus salmonis TaxID=72036 RepID=A0A7R8H5F6_LEPSM|nr:uncharacterized protein LOC121113681 [Lepeophtheirus salmonis]CAB4060534.1 unnamed protein product [Lepeophtheirus salmonis]CAF2867217.1 unnamed protein product [Lepeophtheirus salmonis]